MEEGSLLQEALRSDNNSSLDNSLIVDVYLVEQQQEATQQASSSLSDDRVDIHHQQTQQQELVLALAEICVRLNDHIQSHDYPWISGGDGPVFGLHTTDHTPHLRCKYTYGVSVANEWVLIDLLLQFSRDSTDTNNNNHHHHNSKKDTTCNEKWIPVIECIDSDDGQVLLIESADVLPSWVDELGPAHCQHRCWILGGRVILLAPSLSLAQQNDKDLSMKDALDLLKNASSPLLASYQVVVRSDKIDQAIMARVEKEVHSPRYHCTAVAVPRSVAGLMRRRPDIVGLACAAFAEAILCQQPPHILTGAPSLQSTPKLAESSSPTYTSPLLGTCHDWVWTTHKLGRTQYAMLRSMVSSPYWKSEDTIPSIYQSIETKRIRRQSQVESMPHLRHGLQLGVRIVAGIDYLLNQSAKATAVLNPLESSLSPSERRVLCYWSRILQTCSSHSSHPNDNDSGAWLIQAWQAGPNHAMHDLKWVLRCPIYKEEIEEQNNPTLLSHPEKSVRSQIRQELNLIGDYSLDHIPGPHDVDTDEWMIMPSTDEEIQRHLQQPHNQGTALDGMLNGIRQFMDGESRMEGVVTQNDIKQTDEDLTPIDINPTVFLNLLHAVLQAKTPDEMSFLDLPPMDPYFAKEDYDLMEADIGDFADPEMVDLMNAMDDELLRSTSASRKLDGKELLDEGISDESTEESFHVLSNLLHSIQGAEGRPNPAQNILREMDIQEPEGVNHL